MKKKVSTIALIFVFMAGLAVAGDQQQNQVSTKQQKRDKSCQELTIPTDNFIVKQNRKKTGDKDGTPDRLRDGSCLEIERPAAYYLAKQNGKRTGSQNGSKSRLRDGSCINS